jgi:hypothetical protein
MLINVEARVKALCVDIYRLLICENDQNKSIEREPAYNKATLREESWFMV